MKNKYILTDADGVLLDWLPAFDAWMISQGKELIDPNAYKVRKRFKLDKTDKDITRRFNESDEMLNLRSLRDAALYVYRLHRDHGFKFIVVTSQSDKHEAQKKRISNLQAVFGDTVFEDFIILDTGADKDEVLKDLADKYHGCYWIEDKPENVDVGIELGFDGILVEHDHNVDYAGKAKVASTWKEIYDIITGEK